MRPYVVTPPADPGSAAALAATLRRQARVLERARGPEEGVTGLTAAMVALADALQDHATVLRECGPVERAPEAGSSPAEVELARARRLRAVDVLVAEARAAQASLRER